MSIFPNSFHTTLARHSPTYWHCVTLNIHSLHIEKARKRKKREKKVHGFASHIERSSVNASNFRALPISRNVSNTHNSWANNSEGVRN